TKTSFYRRLLLAHYIDSGINTVPKIMMEIEIPRRTAQDSIASLKDLDIECSFKGALKDGKYIIESWGGISPIWVAENINSIKKQLGY
ncbi:MAG: helix-turn-helix domain-containing protein, partial [Psychromonas sp.]